MDYIASRSFVLPKKKAEMSAQFWFNLWVRASTIHRELIAGDRLYWYETPSQAVVWETTVTEVDRMSYASKAEVASWLEAEFGDDPDTTSAYFRNAPPSGFCLAWKVKATRRLNIPKPPHFRFPQQGWLRVDDLATREWLGVQPSDEPSTLDRWVDDPTDLVSSLEELNERMKELTPERVRRIVSQTIRKDTGIVRTLKRASGFQCQFPGCNAQIRTKDGGLYVEVAHIQPVARKGQSTLGNLLVLCPNHHKEFDHGALVVASQTRNSITGTLNGRHFEIAHIGRR